MSSLAGQVFVVTGSASGIGLATTTTLLTRGARLGLCDLNQDRLSELVNGLSDDHQKRVISSAVDIADRTAVATFLQLTKSHFGRLDGVANIAGTAGAKLGHREIWETEEKEYDLVMGVNVKGIFNVLAEAIKPGLLHEPGGSIVHTASMFGERGFAKGAVYSASKHAGIGMVKSAAIEGARRGIRVNAIMPGPIDTPMLRSNEESGAEGTAPAVPLGRLGKVSEVSNVVAFLLSNEAGYVTGATWAVDGGANA